MLAENGEGGLLAMMRAGLFTLVLLLMSGCATFIGDEPGQAEQTGIDQSQNNQLRTEAEALRQAVREQQEELERLKAESSDATY